jgi:hypothetical protein
VIRAYLSQGESRYEIPPELPLTVGRDADVVVDATNSFLHRRFLSLYRDQELVWIENIGGQLSATVADDDGLLQSWLAPGARIPLVSDRSRVWFTAGPTTYQIRIDIDRPLVAPRELPTPRSEQQTTMSRISLTPDQMRLCLSLSEDVLRRGPLGSGQIPSSVKAAARLGWTMTKFNRKLDNVCEKFAKHGVEGLTMSLDGDAALSRRTRLVEFVVATRLLVADDISLLDQTAAVEHPVNAQRRDR